MKKLNNFIFDNNFREDVKAYIVLNGRQFEAKDKLAFTFDKNSDVLDLMFTLSFLEKRRYQRKFLQKLKKTLKISLRNMLFGKINTIP